MSGKFSYKRCSSLFYRLRSNRIAASQPAAAETRFFPKVMDAEIEFVKDDKGAVTQMILRQGPGEMKATRT